MEFIESNKIEVFPSGMRGTSYQKSCVTSEENLTNLATYRSTTNSCREIDGKYILTIHGYVFSIAKNDVPNKPFATIRLADSNDSIVGKVLANIKTLASTSMSILDDEDGKFYGLGFTDNIDGVDDSLYVSLTNNKGISVLASEVGLNDSTPITENFSTYELYSQYASLTRLESSSSTITTLECTNFILNNNSFAMLHDTSIGNVDALLVCKSNGTVEQVDDTYSYTSSGDYEVISSISQNSVGQISVETRNIPVSTTASDVKMNGTRSAGTSNKLARVDHVHPSDTTKLNTDGVGDNVKISSFTTPTTTDFSNNDTLKTLFSKQRKYNTENDTVIASHDSAIADHDSRITDNRNSISIIQGQQTSCNLATKSYTQAFATWYEYSYKVGGVGDIEITVISGYKSHEAMRIDRDLGAMDSSQTSGSVTVPFRHSIDTTFGFSSTNNNVSVTTSFELVNTQHPFVSGGVKNCGASGFTVAWCGNTESDKILGVHYTAIGISKRG